MRPSQLLAAVVALSSVSAASPDMFEGIHALGHVKDVLVGRQDNSQSSQPESTAAPQTTEAPKESESSKGSDSASATEKPTATKDGDNKSSDSASETGSGKGTKTSGKSKATNFGPDVPAGGIQMVTPAAIAGQQFYKVGDWVTFAWNYTSLSITPSYIDVMASCTANQATYTIAVNQSVEATGKVLWDTGSYQKDHPKAAPFLTETYTLLIYDAASSVSATAKAGYLSTFNSFTFGMYLPQSYTPYADYNCATCSGSLSAFESLTLKAMLLTTFTTLASLVYFASSFGVW